MSYFVVLVYSVLDKFAHITTCVKLLEDCDIFHFSFMDGFTGLPYILL